MHPFTFNPSSLRTRLLVFGLVFAALAVLTLTPLHAHGGTATISGAVWLDRNANGQREADEPLLEGARIQGNLPNPQGYGSVADGTYAVRDLLPGGYTLQGIIQDPNSAPSLISPARTITVTTVVTGADLGLRLPITPRDARYFAQTGYRIDNNLIWDYFNLRGGVDTFGYPVSRTFLLGNVWTQMFQRHVISINGTTARPMNLLDPGLLPATRVNGSTFPVYDAAVAGAAPGPNTPDYGNAVLRHLQGYVPNQWDGKPVRFLDTFLAAAPGQIGWPQTLVALEIWGFPTSRPARDPNNTNFIYQRFQRGILHHDASTGVTRGILLGDAFKSLMTGQNLPADLAADLIASPYLRVYDPTRVNALAPVAGAEVPRSSNTNLAWAFVPAQ